MGTWINNSLKSIPEYYLKLKKDFEFIIECLFSLIYVDKGICASCGIEIDEEKEEMPICTKCRKTIDICTDIKRMRKGNSIIECYSASYYCFATKKLILKLKYQNDFSAADILAQLMLQTIERENLKFDAVVFVPSSRSSLRKRGFNQSKALSVKICRKYGVPLLNCLYKSRSTKDQIGLGSYLRWYNLEGSISVRNDIKIQDKEILLIDDVLTTGATAYYCSEALINKGVKKVIVLTAARSTV